MIVIIITQVSPEDLQRLERRIRSINSMAQIQHTQKADVSVDYVLGVGGFDLDRMESEVRHLQGCLLQWPCQLVACCFTACLLFWYWC